MIQISPTGRVSHCVELAPKVPVVPVLFGVAGVELEGAGLLDEAVGLDGLELEGAGVLVAARNACGNTSFAVVPEDFAGEGLDDDGDGLDTDGCTDGELGDADADGDGVGFGVAGAT